ncbi:tryptophan-rich protein [Plasmodium ovale]|uniref:Tryptophan-rich protein n=1 Tax=Plasmodium ovale TaxID=36330 RepID=A0A1D3JC31_PLAOA|nr:tryptophan-rich protein [Plasmodium ovale]
MKGVSTIMFILGTLYFLSSNLLLNYSSANEVQSSNKKDKNTNEADSGNLGNSDVSKSNDWMKCCRNDYENFKCSSNYNVRAWFDRKKGEFDRYLKGLETKWAHYRGTVSGTKHAETLKDSAGWNADKWRKWMEGNGKKLLHEEWKKWMEGQKKGYEGMITKDWDKWVCEREKDYNKFCIGTNENNKAEWTKYKDSNRESHFKQTKEKWEDWHKDTMFHFREWFPGFCERWLEKQSWNLWLKEIKRAAK